MNDDPQLSDRELWLEMRRDLKEVKAQTTLTNGRVTVLEQWRRELALENAHDAGVQEGRAGVAALPPLIPATLTVSFNRKQLVSVIGGVILVVAAGIWRIVEVGL